MEILLPTRVNLVPGLLGAAFAAMSVSTVGAVLGLAVQPAMDLIGTHANPLVLPTATLLGCFNVWLVLSALRWALVRGAARPSSILAQNQPMFASARVVALVYFAELVVTLVASEIRWFFEFPFANSTQLSVLSPQGRVFMTIVLPAIGIAMLILLAPRILAARSRRAV